MNSAAAAFGAVAEHYPLAGVIVVDLGQIYNGPYATLLLAKAGATVIKIEPPGGEHLRKRKDSGGAMPFAMLNSNKHSATLNLKTDQGKKILLEMVAKADVFVENFAPGTLDRLGVGWDVLSRINPKLVYGASSGYGLSGAARDYPAMDLTVQAMSGVMSITGDSDGPPLKAGPALCDFGGGVHLYGAIMTALFQRERTGRGRFVDVAMQDAVYPSMASNLAMWYQTGGKTPARTGNRHGGLAESPYNIYPTKDGFATITCVGEDHWRRLTEAMQRPDLLTDARYATRPERVKRLDEVDELVSRWSVTLGKYELFDLLTRHRVPCAPIRDLNEVVNDAGMHERGMLEWIDHPTFGRMVVPNSPLRFDGSPPLPATPSAELGQHNSQVYCDWLGYSEDDFAALKQNGII